MRKYIISIIVLISSLGAKAQFDNTDTLRAFINHWIRNSAVESFQNLRLNTAMIGMTNFLDSAYGGQVKNFYAVDDTTLNLVTIVNDTFSVIIRGRGTSINLINVGSGYRAVKTPDGQFRTFFAGYGLTIDSTSNSNGLTFKVDTTGANGLTTRSELKDTTFRLKKAISDSLIYALKSILIPSRLEFIASADTANYQDSALIGSQIMMLSIESYQVGFTTRSTSVYMSFDATTGTISLTNGQFTAGDQVIVIYRTAPVFLLDGSGNPIRDSSGNFIILN